MTPPPSLLPEALAAAGPGAGLFTEPEPLIRAVITYGPYGCALALLISAVVAGLRELLWRWRHARLCLGASVIEIALPPKVDDGSAPAWWSHLVGLNAPAWKRLLFGQPHLAWEFISGENGLRVQVWVPGTLNPVHAEKAIRAAWPGVTLTTHPAAPALPTGAACTGGRLVLGRADHYPLRVKHDNDPLRALLESMSGLGRGEYAAVQILARPVTGRRLRRALRAASRLKTGTGGAPQAALFDLITPGMSSHHSAFEIAALRPERTEEIKAILGKASQPRFEVQVRYAVATSRRVGPAARPWLRSHAHEIASTFALFTSGHQHLRRRHLHHPTAHLAARRLRRSYLLAVTELAALAHLPLDLAAPGVLRAGARPVAPAPSVPELRRAITAGTPVRMLGDAEAGAARDVALGVVEARQHVHVLGQTGVGKSTFLANLVLDDATAGRGAIVLDPKGDLINDILDRLPHRAIGRTVVFDPADPAAPPSINVLAAGSDPVFASDAVTTIFRRCFSSAWGPRLDDLMRSACLTLAQAQGDKASLADVPRLLTEAPYRARIVNRLGKHDELLRGFWAAYDDLTPGARASTIGPVMNKLRAVLLRPFVRDALSGANGKVHLGQLLGSGGLVLARLPKGVLGDDAARLFGSLLIAHTWQAITPRALLPEDQRRDCAVYVDECHNFLNLPGSISDVLAEARGYRLSMFLAHQHLSQLPRDLQEAISADTRNKIYFAASPEDATDLARHTAPLLGAHDLSHLGAFQAAARIITGTQAAPAFTFRTRPLPPVIEGRAEQIRASSREVFTSPPPDRPDLRHRSANPDDRTSLKKER